MISKTAEVLRLMLYFGMVGIVLSAGSFFLLLFFLASSFE